VREACGVVREGGPIRAVSKPAWRERQPTAPMEATQGRARGRRCWSGLGPQADMDGAGGRAARRRCVGSSGRSTVEVTGCGRASGGAVGGGALAATASCERRTACVVDGGASSREERRSGGDAVRRGEPWRRPAQCTLNRGPSVHARPRRTTDKVKAVVRCGVPAASVAASLRRRLAARGCRPVDAPASRQRAVQLPVFRQRWAASVPACQPRPR
jgi:hypothetical protein